jgi:hypothetical protein
MEAGVIAGVVFEDTIRRIIATKLPMMTKARSLTS